MYLLRLRCIKDFYWNILNCSAFLRQRPDFFWKVLPETNNRNDNKLRIIAIFKIKTKFHNDNQRRHKDPNMRSYRTWWCLTKPLIQIFLHHMTVGTIFNAYRLQKKRQRKKKQRNWLLAVIRKQKSAETRTW